MRNESSIYDLFYGDGKLKREVELSEAFLRPVYQYTPQEIRNKQRDSWEKESDSNLKLGEING